MAAVMELTMFYKEALGFDTIINRIKLQNYDVEKVGCYIIDDWQYNNYKEIGVDAVFQDLIGYVLDNKILIS